LKEEGHAIDTAYDGEEGYFLAKTNEYDLIVLDIMLPKMDGINLCRGLREMKINAPYPYAYCEGYCERQSSRARCRRR